MSKATFFAQLAQVLYDECMRKLILVKHARPEIDPEVVPSRWELSAAGRDSCAELAAKLAPHQPAVLLSSVEPKARQTADLLAAELSIPTEVAEDLHEHERDEVPHMQTRDFLSLMAMVFKQPHRLILGRETADQAGGRFLDALDAAVEKYPQGNIGIVSHGTVIALAIAYHTGQDGYQLWRTMGLPSYAVLELPGYRLIEVG